MLMPHIHGNRPLGPPLPISKILAGKSLKIRRNKLLQEGCYGTERELNSHALFHAFTIFFMISASAYPELYLTMVLYRLPSY